MMLSSTKLITFIYEKALIIIPVFLRRFRDPILVPRISNRVPRIREKYHRVPKIRENRVPRIREIGSLQIQTGFLTFSSKKTLNNTIIRTSPRTTHVVLAGDRSLNHQSTPCLQGRILMHNHSKKTFLPGQPNWQGIARTVNAKLRDVFADNTFLIFLACFY